MISKPLVAASSKPLLLAILRGGESYGYEIIRRIREASAGQLDWSEPMLYPLLKRLERDGLVTSAWKPTPNNRLRKYYRLTDKGRREQEKENAQWFLVDGILKKMLAASAAGG
jgi:PadR family transcriptional regulator PadR